MVAYTSRYIITPKETLIQTLANYGINGKEAPYIWAKSEGGYTWLDEADEFLQVKLLWLVRIWYSFDTYADKNYREAYKAILGEPPFSVEIFDQWWTVIKTGAGGDFFNYLEHTSASALQLLAKTGNGKVDSWVEEMIAMKRESKTQP